MRLNEQSRNYESNWISAPQITQLPDAEMYKLDVESVAMRATQVAANWPEKLQSLHTLFPNVTKDTIILSLIVAYMSRVSEEGDAIFPVSGGNTSAKDHAHMIVTGIRKEDIFENVVSNISQDRLRFTLTNGMNLGDRSDQQCHFLVSLDNLDGLSNYHADVRLDVDPSGSISWKHSANIKPAFIELLSERIEALADGILAHPTLELCHQPIMSARERALVVEEWNNTAKEYGYDGGLVAMMEKAAEQTPDHPALMYKDTTLSFEEFNKRTNRLAAMLRAKGVGKDRFVCLCMERSAELVIAIWATLKAGGAYVPLNTQDPLSRINEIVDDCQPVVLLTQPQLLDQLTDANTDVVALPDGGDLGSEFNCENPGTEIEPGDLAYMIYTSGSTGKPKGVVVEHEAIHNRVVWMHEEYGLDPSDRVLQKTPYTFDVSVWEFLWSFSVGSTLVVAEPGGHVAMGYMYQLIRKTNVTHLHFVPSVLRLFLMCPAMDQLPIKKLFCSGEALGFDSVMTFYEKANDYAEVHNLYGPTEAAVDVSYFHCPREPENNQIPIGLPVTNTSLLVLDDQDQPVPVGIPGELHIGGVQLARGYWAREELTAERFVNIAIEGAPHQRLYRTGDLAYFRPDGQIIYMGRNDFQVKINGVRMELGEIEAAIREDSDVKDVVVVAEENLGNKILIAYVVAKNHGSEKEQALKDNVASTRPSYYVPKEIRFLADMPLTVSGKIDRRLLATAERV